MIQPTDEQRRQWTDEGYLVLERAVTGELLRRLHEAHVHWSEQCKEEWLERVEAAEFAATYYDVPNPFDKDEIFVELVDHPSWYDLLMDFMDGDLMFNGPQLRTVPNWPVSYTRWHPDIGQDSPIHIKVQVYFNDVGPEGAFGFVPGSHKMKHQLPYVHRLRSMPGHKVIGGKAGTTVMFNTRGTHAAMENKSGSPRRSVILCYKKRSEWQGSPDKFARIAHLCKTPERRRLLCLE